MYGLEDLVSALLEVYPKAVRQKNSSEFPEAAREIDSLYGKLPLERAINRKCQSEILVALLKAYPEAAKKKINEGQLCLHYAISEGYPASVVSALLEAYPEGAMEKNYLGVLSIHIATKSMTADV
eukprot:gene31254-35667_t